MSEIMKMDWPWRRVEVFYSTDLGSFWSHKSDLSDLKDNYLQVALEQRQERSRSREDFK